MSQPQPPAQPYGSSPPTYAPPAYAPPGSYAAPPTYGPPPGWGPQPAVPAQDPIQQFPGQPGHAAGGQLAITSCRFCGNVPAVHTTFRGHQGMLVLMRFLSVEGPFCRDCGLGTFRHMTSRTLVQGWYSYGSLLAAPITVLINVVRRGKVAKLPAPQPNPYGPSRRPMDPGKRLLQRPMTWLGLAIPVALFAFLFAAFTS